MAAAAGEVRHCCSCSPRSAATKDDPWKQRGPICWAGLGHPVSPGLQTAIKRKGAAPTARSQRRGPFPLHDGARPRVAHLLANTAITQYPAPVRALVVGSE